MSRLRSVGTTLAVASLLVATAGATASAESGAARSSAPDDVWRADGYGMIVAIRDGTLRQYQTTSVGCLPGPSARRSGTERGETMYDSTDGMVVGVRPARRPNRAELRFTHAPGHRELHRISALPRTCTRPPASGPVAAFDTFWQSYQENYPFFAAKGVDWHAMRDRYRPRVGPNTTEDQLFAIMRDMIDPLDDAHVDLTAGPDRYFTETRPGTTAPTADFDRRVRAYIVERDLGGRPLTQYANGRVAYADLPDGQGYLRINAFMAYLPDRPPSYLTDSAELDRALDAFLTPDRLDRLRGLIIDVRVNDGGMDNLGLRLAARLSDRPYLAYVKQARNDPRDPSRFTRPQPIEVRPNPETTRYTGPVAILTGGSTVSAGETFVQAMMGRAGSTIRIGEATQGVFSDVMQRRLPNGWQAGVPNEVFRTRDGRTFDGTGIPPNVLEPVFTEDEFANHRDSAFDRAVRMLPTGRAPGVLPTEAS
ncbi:S41 family peptidase [Embleya scabrispora]|uniref:S41 family peptidase n=1 Tax=Embleya scabrispora TaxID=159449 RepID=UPI00068B5D55|nr:S41 family peptidase [Embleya scabrispora]MYS86264.1 protease [Streptomyces sp. SID5474]